MHSSSRLGPMDVEVTTASAASAAGMERVRQLSLKLAARTDPQTKPSALTPVHKTTKTPLNPN